MKKYLSVILAVLLAISFSACGVNQPAEREDPEIPEVSENPEAAKEKEPEKTEEPIDFGRKEVSAENFEHAVEIVLSGSEVTVDGKTAEESDSVTVGGEIVYYHDMDFYKSGNVYGEGDENDKHTEEEAAEHTLVTITKPGKYFVRGEMKGQLAVDLGEKAEKDPNAKVTLIFGGADISCEIAPAVIFYNVYECGDPENAVSEVDTSKAGANVIIADGSISNINGANVAKIYKDNSEEKKLHKYDAALYSKMSMNVYGDSEGTGVLNINAENEGMGTELHLTINGGNINITAENDGINTNEDGVSVVTINGGKLVANGGFGIEGDGIDSNGWININGGEVFLSGNGRSGDSGIDADNEVLINGGKVVSFGSQNDSVSGNSKAAFAQILFVSPMNGENKIEFVDSEGKGIAAESEREFHTLVIAGEDIVKEKEYHLYVNGIMQEFSSNMEPFRAFTEGMGGLVDSMFGKMEENFGKKNPYEVPEDLDKWLESEDDMPEEIREWINTMKDASGKMGAFGRFSGMTEEPAEENNRRPEIPKKEENADGGVELAPEQNVDRTVFVITDESYYFSGVCDSAKATGKTRVYFTVNGEDRIDDIYKGDLPGIESIECTEKVEEKDVTVNLIYSGRDESIDVSRSCSLSDGYEAVNKLFEGLEAGSYRLIVSVNGENTKYMGSATFYITVVE